MDDIEAANAIATVHQTIEDGIGFEAIPFEVARWIMNNKDVHELSKQDEIAGAYYPLVSGKGSSMVYRSASVRALLT